MAAGFDAIEFVDQDFETSRRPAAPTTQTATAMTVPSAEPERAPTREEVDFQVGQLQAKLAELRRAQSELERERASLEETRRRQIGFTTGREELIRDLSRGLELLEQRELAARREAEQMARTLVDLKESLTRLQAIHPESWTKENFATELSRALGVVDHARLEWNTARLKFPVLNGVPATPAAGPAESRGPTDLGLAGRGFLDTCRLGLALTWPIALAALLIFVVLLLR